MLPLSGMRVIAVEQYGAGPYGSMQLADLGAEVIKIENPADGGDMSPPGRPVLSRSRGQPFLRQLQPQQEEHHARPEESRRRARCCTRWWRQADGVLDNLRGDLPEKLGLTYAALAPANPRIVCAHLVGLRPQRLTGELAGLRLSDAGRSRLPVADRRAGWTAGAHGAVDRRHDDGPVRRLRAGLRHHRARARPA